MSLGARVVSYGQHDQCFGLFANVFHSLRLDVRFWEVPLMFARPAAT
jgi:hypothetical protein